MLDVKPKPKPHESSSSSSSESIEVKSNLGPLTCGDKSTIGLPCLAKPVLGKCRIGICMAKPEGSTFSEKCETVCRYIKDYDCGCECDGAWLKTCGSINGRVVNDKDKNHKYNASVDGLLGGVIVKLTSRSSEGGNSFVAQQTTSSNGHYAFIGLAPGSYRISAKFPGCFTSSDSHVIELECLEQSSNALRAEAHGVVLKTGHISAYSAKLEQRSKATHLADNVDIFATEDCDAASDAADKSDDVFSDDFSDFDGDGDGSSTWVVIVIVAVTVCICGCVCFGCWMMRKRIFRQKSGSHSR